jgi:hypothetical protein
MANNYSWFKIDASGEAVILNKPLENYLASLGDYVHLVAFALRPGVCHFMMAFEAMHFTPGTPANDSYHVTMVNWQGAGWSIASFPIGHLKEAEKLLPRFGLKLVRGEPAVLTGRTQGPCGIVGTCTPEFLAKLEADYESFPLSGLPHVYTLENIAPGKGPHIAGVMLSLDWSAGVNRG